MKGNTERAFENAMRVIKLCSSNAGLFASGGKNGYDAIWARDSMISLISASCTGEFRDVFKRSLVTLAKHQINWVRFLMQWISILRENLMLIFSLLILHYGF